LICPVLGQPAARLLFTLTRAGTQLDPGTAAVIELLREIASLRPDGITAPAVSG